MNQNPKDELDLIEQKLQENLQKELGAYDEPQIDIIGQPSSPSHSSYRTASPQSRSSLPPQTGARQPARQKSASASSQSPKQRAPKTAQARRAHTGRAAQSHSSYSNREIPPSKKTKKKKKSVFRRIVAALLILCLVIGGLWYLAVSFCYGRMNYTEIPSRTQASMKDNGVVNILLIGNDSRSNGADGRSDAMILLSISKKTRTISMMSLLRDMYVEIPGYSSNRLNAAYSYGGADLLMETLEQNLGIEINRCIQVNFEAFANLTDAVGGVDLELSNEEVQYVNGYLAEYNTITGREYGTDYLDSTLSGMIHLNGPQALAYCRNRYIGTDFGRTERQRKVLGAILQKLPGTLITNPGGLINGLFPNLTTNLTKWECMELSLHVFSLGTYEIVQGSIPIEGTYQNTSVRGMSVLQVDFDANLAYLRNLLYGE